MALVPGRLETVSPRDGQWSNQSNRAESPPPTRRVPPRALGLTSAEVAERIERGQVNRVEDATSRSVEDIIRANVFTRFNAILGSLLVVILIVGPLNDALFGIVLVSNAVIGIVQEVRAKRTLDKLALLSAPQARVLRDGTEARDPDVRRGAGRPRRHLPRVTRSASTGSSSTAEALEVDESLLTGESDPDPQAASATSC